MVNELKSKGYNIYSERTGGDAISDITVSPTMKIEADSTATINVTLVPNPNSVADYYAVEGGKYYKMHYGTDRVTIDKTESSVSGTGVGGSNDLTAEIKTGSTGTGISIGTISGNSIPLSSTENAAGTTTIVVSYGNISKECKVSIAIVPTYSEENMYVSFDDGFGIIDIIWLNGTGTEEKDVTDTPNSPETHLAGMTPVKFASDGTIIPTTTSDTSWYSYNAGETATATASGLPDNNTSNWANAQNSDESLFVWIPRFAYRITYYDTRDKATGEIKKAEAVTNDSVPTGYYDGYGMWRASTGQIIYKLESTIKTVDYNGDKYIIHPAFCNGATDGYEEGQWSSALEGFWVAKYEMSKETKNINDWITATLTTGNSKVDESTRAVSKFGKSSWREICVGNCYYNALHYSDNDENECTINSHLMKNSEWGAVAYLTHSKYGRNGNEISLNNSSSYITGTGGTEASTTGNYYGIFDLSGGAHEFLSVFNNTDINNYIATYGWSEWSTELESNAYATKYSNISDKSSNTEICEFRKTGDAIREVYRKNSDRYAWNNDIISLPTSKEPFLIRGGWYGDTGGFNSGIFYSSSNWGPGGRSVF